MLLSLGVGSFPVVGLAQQTAIPPAHHPWGRFQPGAWKLVRVVTETIDENRQVANTAITETKTTLTQVEKDGVTLCIEVMVEVAGKRFQRQPQTVKQGFHGEPMSQDLQIKGATAGKVTIEGRVFPCKIFQLLFSGPANNNKTVSNVYYSNKTIPYVLKRTSVTADPEEKKTLSKTVVAVVALDMPWKVLAEIKSSVLVRTIREHAKGTITTWAVTTSDVPGGVICHSSKEIDKTGRMVRRSTLELIEYGLELDKARVGLFDRKRDRRTRRTSTRRPPR